MWRSTDCVSVVPWQFSCGSSTSSQQTNCIDKHRIILHVPHTKFGMSLPVHSAHCALPMTTFAPEPSTHCCAKNMCGKNIFVSFAHTRARERHGHLASMLFAFIRGDNHEYTSACTHFACEFSEMGLRERMSVGRLICFRYCSCDLAALGLPSPVRAFIRTMCEI